MRHADLALYEAKKTKNNFAFYTKQLKQSLMNKLQVQQAIKKAFNNNEFYCLYQPQVDIESKQVVGVEALVRWDSMTSEKFFKNAPSKFVPAMSELGFSQKLNQYIVKRVLADCEELKDITRPLKIGINLSLNIDSFEAHVKSLLKIISAEKLNPFIKFEFEFTEENFMSLSHENEKQIENITKLFKKENVSLAIDDFGMKYSSMSRFISYPFSTVKLDKSFVDKLSSKVVVAIIRSISSLANDLDIDFIAEGVEDEKQVKKLQSLAVNTIQGNFYHKPLTIQDLASLVFT